MSTPSATVKPCKEWTGSRTPGGYGKTTLDGRTTTAHRVAWMEATGQDIPVGFFILHRCDNPPCVEPSHLFLGTPRDNMADMIAKGRDNLKHPAPYERNPGRTNPRIGVLNGHARLTEVDVRLIRVLAAAGLSYPRIAARFGMSRSGIGDVVRRRRWAHVTD